MTITLVWWWLPIAIVAAAIAGACFVKDQGDYDFGSPILRFAILAAGLAGAIGIVLGKFLS